MPHFKCVACKARMYRAAGPENVVRDQCPGCGSSFEPVGELAEIVGFKSVDAHESGVGYGLSDAHQRLADRVNDVFARHATIRGQERLAAARWVDDGGSFRTEVAADSHRSAHTVRGLWPGS